MPRTPVEQELAKIWATVLQVEQVGIHDNFFELGGHSLLAARVITRIQDALKLEIPLRQLFATPTIAELAISIENMLWAKQDVSLLQTSSQTAVSDYEEGRL
jgi:acyl carrier protein